MGRGFVGILWLGAALGAAATDPPAERHFVEKVKPLLESRCVSCHGPEKSKGSLRLDSLAGILKGGESGPAMVPGKPAESLLLQAVMHAKKDLEMPPKEKLTPNDIAVLRQWIVDGAPWPTTASGESLSVTAPMTERIGDAWTDRRNPIVRIFNGERLEVWSLKPVQAMEPPRIRAGREARPKEGKAPFESRAAPVRNPIDRFVIARLREHGLTLSREADRRTLARRLYFDLTGLPPTPEEVAEFAADAQSGAYERLVDKLLASPRYGEHAARRWMDVIRYSDSNGFDWDEFRPQAWRFRDYLIRSFNADKPFDQLIREQLAGDELVEGEPASERERDCLIATGYLRMGSQDNSAGLFNEQARARSEVLFDLTETTSSAFLGLTMSCCRCHNHKYDPLSQADHYRMRAFFEPVKYGDEIALDLASEQKGIRESNAAIDKELKPLKERRSLITADARKRIREKKLAPLSPAEKALLDLPKEKQTAAQKEETARLEKKIEIKEKEIATALTDSEKAQMEQLGREISKLEQSKRRFTTGLLATDDIAKPAVTRILYQGDYKSEREVVQPGFISILDPNAATIQRPPNRRTTGRRYTLANWIASTNNPLTARVFVNRLWQDHFGKGLVATANDFGLAGARPADPKLLDWLAAEFMRQDWSIKRLHRLIALSATYRQASTAQSSTANRVDPENAMLWRQNLRRLTAEQLRDALLAVSGMLKVDHQSGPPVWPELPAEVLQANPAFLDDNAEKTKGWYPAKKEDQAVRSVFLVQKRTVRVPFMETFDLPENTVSCARRNESIVAPQALALLNGLLTREAAQVLSSQIVVVAGSNPTRQVDEAFLKILQRLPRAGEASACIELLRAGKLTDLCRALLNVNEFVYID